MKDWPENNQTVDFGTHLADPVLDAINQVYELVRKPGSLLEDWAGVTWLGMDIGKADKASCFSPDEALSRAALDYNEEDQGRSVLATIIGIAIQTGIEQGRRMEATKWHSRV